MFHVGDWVFCEFKLQQIETMNEGRITAVRDHVCSHGSYDLSDRCFPLDLTVMGLSELAREWYQKIHERGLRDLNYPYIRTTIIDNWTYLCRMRDDQSKVNEGVVALGQFCQSLLDRIAILREEEIGSSGVKLLRR